MEAPGPDFHFHYDFHFGKKILKDQKKNMF